MESRWNVRFPVRTAVGIQHFGRRLVTGRTRDLSFEGTYVETDPRRLTVDAQVQVLFPEIGPPAGRIFAVPAVVVRATRDGVALKFADTREARFESLTGLVQNLIGRIG